MSILALILAVVFLLGIFLLRAAGSGLRALEHTRSLEQLEKTETFFVYRAILKRLTPNREIEVLFFSLSTATHLYRIAYIIAATLLVWVSWIKADAPVIATLVSIVAVLLSLFVGDYLPRLWANGWPQIALKTCAPFASIFLIVTLPLNLVLLLVTPKQFTSPYLEHVREPVGQVKEKILEMLHQAEAYTSGDQTETELLESAASLRDTLIREVMIPRVDMYSLPASTTIREAAKLHVEHGYSRIPVYGESVDSIVGLMLYKDVSNLYFQCEQKGDHQALDYPIEGLLKPILFVPETSRVSRVLQDFRRRQTHLAIVVDEYGGTEGLVTIEDCLEELVGEIVDEYDTEEEELYTAQADGGWIVDARMNIGDIEEEFGIKIPQEGDYDTIGGYAFHRAGEIPAKGLKIYHDDFELEILESSDRAIEKILIQPTEKK